MTMYSLSEYEQYLCEQIVDCAYTVHKKLDSGLLEKIYEACFCYELQKRGIRAERQKSLPIYYDELVFDEGLCLDVLVDEIIICEIKAVELVNALWQAQIISHLKLDKRHVGFLLNFNVAVMKNGARRFCVE